MLIEELKKDHEFLITHFDGLKDVGFTTKEGQAQLFKLKNTLIRHLEKEDQQLYPTLQKFSQSDQGVASLLKQFIGEMDEISRDILYFFDKYSEESSDLGFAKDYGRLLAQLRKRLYREENILYEKYNDLIS